MSHPASLSSFSPRAVGFRSGLEVHHQLDTRHKLFCRCPVGLYSDHYDMQVLRHMRPTLSELGEYDGTALMEFKTKKDIVYRLNKQSVCTYEMDDNPPFLINREAVDIAVEIALMLNCAIVGELHVARKQYLDGSIPAGFQRTAIVGLNGWIPYKGRRIGIRQLAVEEDACREIADIGHLRIYATDRLSMPLIEVVTAPDMLEPQEVFEVGTLIGSLLRATGRVRRGLGSVRQDVNVSVAGGTRIEIKGVPRLKQFPDLVFWEAFRQHRLLALRDRLLALGLNPNHWMARKHLRLPLKLTSPLVPDASGIAFGVAVLPGFNGVLAEPIGRRRVFADDIAGRVRVIACIPHRPVMGVIEPGCHLSLSESDAAQVREAAGIAAGDTAVVVWGVPSDVETALNEIENRCRELLVGVPSETRQALPDGETDFERILPGPDRMYPDTDSPPLALKPEYVAEVRGRLAERPWERRQRLEALGLSPEQIQRMLTSPRIQLFSHLAQRGFEPRLTATVLGELLVHIHRLGADLKALADRDIENLLELYHQGDIGREAVRMLLELFAAVGKTDWNELARWLNIHPIPESEAARIVDEVIHQATTAGPADPEARRRFIMGLVMNRLRGSFPGRKAAAMVNELLSSSAVVKA